MIINNAPQHEAVLSNVGEIGEFRIRNSAKAFNILSSGLYANKIKAIIRELSCNAVDSHVAAGRSDVPFDVHLPNQLDPTFRIRDYGTGLSHEQVINIYTTYFESTKTESNQFIGALGLGSKSPFSYTDNFTVTAIQDGHRNVYSAFINGEGVPSIALMHDEATDQPNGVEIQFAVTDRWDFDKFRSEARDVYTYFALRPNVQGGDSEFVFRDIEYKDRNIIPGVHYVGGRSTSRAVMGNIAYPIDMPNADTNLGELARLLGCGLEMHFDIGELDFQASREGLSYITSTIDAIKAKLVALNAQLAVHLDLEASTITNAWEKTYFLQKKAHEDLWAGATRAYIAAKQPAMLDFTNLHYVRAETQKFDVLALAAQHNIAILAFTKNRSSVTCQDLKPHKDFKDRNYNTFDEVWHFSVDPGTVFVTNDLKVGALNRAKYHWRHAASKGIKLPSDNYSTHVYVLSAATKGHVMDLTGFFAAIHNPPESQIVAASSLLEKERKTAATRGKDVRIVRLERKDYGRRGNDNLVWGEAGSADQYCDTVNYYYVPLSNYTALNTKLDPKTIWDKMRQSGISALAVDVHGVRKGDIEFIQKQKNWINIETYLAQVLNNLNPKDLVNLALNDIDNSAVLRYNKTIVHNIKDPNSAYLALVSKFENVNKVRYNKHALEYLLKTYAPGVSIQSMIDSINAEIESVNKKYPLLPAIRDYSIPELAVAQYINLIDNLKGN